jgi:hypothetical protein
MPDIEKLLSAIDWAEENAYGSDSDGQLAKDRAYSIQLYLGDNVDPAPTGRSQVVDRSVFETIQWIMPSLCRIFANGSDLVSIPPIGPDDEEGAKQEAEYINWVMTQSNPWFKIFHTWALDALLTRNAYVVAYKDKRRSVDVEVYERQTEEGVALLMQDNDVEIIEGKQYPDEQAQPEPMVDEMGQPVLDEMGQPAMQPPGMLYDLKLRRVGEHSKICIKNLPPERVKVSEFANNESVSDVDYFEFYEFKTLSDLRAEGFDIPDDIGDDNTADTEEDIVRDQYNETRDENKRDPSMRRVKVRSIWIRHDYDGDGIAELRYIVRIGKSEVLPVNEEASSIPAACIVPSPLPHRHMGMSLTDQVADIQRIKTTIMRQGLDNLYLSNNPQKVIDQNRVNLDDILSSVPGGIIRVDGTPDAIRYEIPPFVFPQAMEGMEYMDQVKENRTGTSRYFTGIDQNALNKTATGIQQLSTMAAQRVEQIARILGSGVEDLARVVHELILRMGHKTEVVKIRGEWVEVDPASWKKRSDFKIAVGFASGNKDAQVARLQMISMQQFQALQLGLPIVQPQNIYETQLELTKASDFSSPERFWTDPATIEQPPQQPDPESMKMQAEMVAREAELTLQQETAQAEHALKEREIQTKAELEKYKIDTDAQVKLTLGRMQGENAVGVERERANTQAQKQDRMKVENLDKLDSVVESVEGIAETSAEQVQAVTKAMSDAVQALTAAVEKLGAPKKVVRGKDGRVEQVVSG